MANNTRAGNSAKSIDNNSLSNKDLKTLLTNIEKSLKSIEKSSAASQRNTDPDNPKNKGKGNSSTSKADEELKKANEKIDKLREDFVSKMGGSTSGKGDNLKYFLDSKQDVDITSFVRNNDEFLKHFETEMAKLTAPIELSQKDEEELKEYYDELLKFENQKTEYLKKTAAGTEIAKKQLELEKEKANLNKQKASDKGSALGGGDFETSFLGKLINGFSDGASSFLEGFSGSVIGTIVGTIGNAISSAATAIADSLTETFGSSIESMVEQMKLSSTLQARYIKDSEDNLFVWQDIVTQANDAGNVTYKNTKLLENYVSLIQRGIQDNNEIQLNEYAKIVTLKDELGATFELYSEKLLNLIYIQNQNTTETRIGLERALNGYLTQLTENTRYLSDMYKSVTDALYEMETQMTGAASTELEFVVQKWMGTLYDSGFSSSSVNAIVQAINSLGTGDTSNISSASATLLEKAAASAGLNYGSMLVNGVDSTTIDLLLTSVLMELSDANQGSNNVVRRKLAELYGVNLSDLTVAGQLVSEGTFDLLRNSENLTYTQMHDMYNVAMEALSENQTIYEILDNFTENFTSSVGASVASNPVNYMNYKLGTSGPLRGTLVGSLLTIGAMGEGLNQAAVQVQASGALEDAISNKVDENLGEAVSEIVGLLGTLGSLGSTINGLLTSIESLLVRFFNWFV